MGGFAGIQQRLAELAELGITAIELMPVAEFPGAHNWGYDGVLPFAPDASYGTPDQLKALIDTAHGLGMMVFLDVSTTTSGRMATTCTAMRRISSAMT